MLESIQKWFFNQTLKRKIDNNPTKSNHNINFDRSKSIGILFDGNVSNNFVTIEKYASELRLLGKSVTLLGYMNVTDKEGNLNHTYFCKNDLNWAKIPISKKTQDFINVPFDILMCLCINNSIQLDYIAALSKAKVRVGKYDADNDFYDLMIDSSSHNKNLNTLIFEIDKYLKLVNQ